MTTISSDFTTQQTVPNDGDVLTIGKDVDGIVDGTAIDAGTTADGRSITVKGHVEANGDAALSPDAINLGISGSASDATGNVIAVAASGSLKAVDSGIEAYAAGTQITNDGSIKAAYGIRGDLGMARIANNGTIDASTAGAYLHGESIQFDNAGTLKSTGSYALRLFDDFNAVTNTGSITAANGVAVYFQSDAGETGYFENHGTISGKTTAFKGGAGDETVKNYGTISGDVVLGDGENSFINKKGSVDGVVYGGADADSYTIKSGTIAISEAKGGSNMDHVYSSVTATLAKYVEILTLSGSDDIDGTGNGSDNSIFGNAHDNTLKGGGGDDYIVSAAGKDVLTGGDGADLFYFDDGYGKDTITDFEDGIDRIEPFAHAGTPDYASLKSHMSQDGSDVVIDFGNGDVLTIEDIKLKQLTQADFVSG